MAASRLNRCIWQYEVRVAVLTFGFKLPAICTAKFTLRASLAERLAKVDFKNSAPLAALTLSLVGINLTWPFPVLEGVSSDPQFSHVTDQA